MSGAAGQLPPVDKPSVLIIGGLGYIGRFLAHHIHTHKLASTLRIVDKQLPQLALLAPEHLEACSEPHFVQADASRPQALSRIFTHPSDDPARQFDYVFNCGGETRFSQEDEVYKARSHALSLNVGREAARRGVRAFVELSTAQVYEPKRDPPRRETDRTKPSNRQAKWKLLAEDDLRRVEHLDLVVLRLAHVYGPYTGKWLGTQLALARVYQDLDKELKYLWSADLRTNTVHVADVVRACWAAAEWRAANKGQPEVFNIVDQGRTSQGTIVGIMKDLFGIDTGFQNTLINTFAKLNLEKVVDEVNDETLDVWAELQQQAEIDAGSGPLTPFMEKELLKDVDLSVDGSHFEKVVGFNYEHTKITKKECEDVIESYKRMKWWP